MRQQSFGPMGAEDQKVSKKDAVNRGHRGSQSHLGIAHEPCGFYCTRCLVRWLQAK
jgi:hypothetical protein